MGRTNCAAAHPLVSSRAKVAGSLQADMTAEVTVGSRKLPLKSPGIQWPPRVKLCLGARTGYASTQLL